MIGYKKANIPLQIKESMNLELGDITLEEDSYILSTVNIIGKRPPIKAEPGKMTVNLSSALLSTDGNILDALRKLPGVIVQNDGTIILNGKSGANVLMDDKVTYLSGENLINYLRSIPASSIENIELISQPSSTRCFRQFGHHKHSKKENQRTRYKPYSFLRSGTRKTY